MRGTLHKYVARLTEFIAVQREKLDSCGRPEVLQELADKRSSLKLDR